MAEYIERWKLPKRKEYWDDDFGAGWDACLDAIDSIPSADVRPVVTCAECKWWTKQEASLQGRCELMQIYPTGAWFCANGRRDDEKNL